MIASTSTARLDVLTLRVVDKASIDASHAANVATFSETAKEMADFFCLDGIKQGLQRNSKQIESLLLSILALALMDKVRGSSLEYRRCGHQRAVAS